MLKILIGIILTALLVSCVPVKTCMTYPCDSDLDDLFDDLNDSADDEFEVNTPAAVIPVRGSVDGENSRDIERLAAVKEQQILAQRAERISAQFGLSSERGTELARLYTIWSKKSSMRSLSQMEQDQMSIRIMGSDFATLRNATMRAAHGDSQLLDQVANKAALLNGTTPEHMREILSNALVD